MSYSNLCISHPNPRKFLLLGQCCKRQNFIVKSECLQSPYVTWLQSKLLGLLCHVRIKWKAECKQWTLTEMTDMLFWNEFNFSFCVASHISRLLLWDGVGKAEYTHPEDTSPYMAHSLLYTVLYLVWKIGLCLSWEYAMFFLASGFARKVFSSL